MTIDDFQEKLRNEITDSSQGRAMTSAFLIWFAENYLRIDREEAIDCVCDHPNDKGIDGILTDDEEEITYLLQSKFSPENNQDQGDVDLRNFIGARSWFDSIETIEGLLRSKTSEELKSLVKENKLTEKVHYKLISIFVTNKVFDKNAKDYIKTNGDVLESWDRNSLFGKYTYFLNEEVKFKKMDLYLENKSRIIYNLKDEIKVVVYSITAKELVKLEGIQNGTLFHKNVRYGLGKTRVNKSIKGNITDLSQHPNFFLYHNGITIVCEKLIDGGDLNNKISIENYAVVNGCQSILTLYENKDQLTKNLSIAVKIIQSNPNSILVKNITYYTNNQNAIGIKDLRSNDSVQRSIQKEFKELFHNKILYNRKRGENENGYEKVIDKDFAAQIIAAVYLERPHDTHLKQKLFGEDYNKVFSRRINAEKIYLGTLIYDVVRGNSLLLDKESIRNYGLALFFFSYAISLILKEDNLGKKILDNPKKYVTDSSTFTKAIVKLWKLNTPDINFEIDNYIVENNGFFDYKNVFKNADFVQRMGDKIKTNYIKSIRRRAEDSFEKIYNEP